MTKRAWSNVLLITGCFLLSAVNYERGQWFTWRDISILCMPLFYVSGYLAALYEGASHD